MSHDPADGAAGPWAALAGTPYAAARALLGAELRLGDVVVRLTEVEAYGGADDAGSHAHRGRTPRTAVMFGPAGRLYCYLSYGMHVCANVVCGPEGEAGAVLLRAGEVVSGASEARGRRGTASDRDLARGPGRLCRALGIGLDHDGCDLSARRPGPALLLCLPVPDDRVRTGPRVGLRGAADRPWRLWLADEPTVSAYRRHARAESETADASGPSPA